MRIYGFILATALLLAGPWQAAAQVIKGQVRSVGFLTDSGPVIREGQWFPVEVQLAAQGQAGQVFDGALVLETTDLDGDRVEYVRSPVALGLDDGGARKTFWCYGAVNEINELPQNLFVVRREDRAPVIELPLPIVQTILDDDVLVLDISDQRIVKLKGLAVPNFVPGQPTEGMREYYRAVVYAHMPAASLPDRWLGLEPVDIIVWDHPRPNELSVAQRDALQHWVRNGGQLVLGVGANWGELLGSDLAEILPLTGGGQVETQRLDAFFAALAPAAMQKRTFDAPIVVTTADLAPGAVATLGDLARGEKINLIAMRLVDSGRVVTTAASLRDLTSIPLHEQRIFGALFDLNTYADKYREEQLNTAQMMQFFRDPIYNDLVQPISFGGQTALRGLTAFLFVAAYVALATVASWWWLSAHKMTQASWSVFAGFAVVASVLSLGTVAALRTLSRGMQTVSFVDTTAGTLEARGPFLMGYRSPRRQRVNMAMAGDSDFIRPLARNPRVKNYYVTPSRYEVNPTQAEVSDALVRATLKQFEGYWHGELSGVFGADLTVSRKTGRVTPGSFLRSDLNVDLRGAYLLYIDPRLDDWSGVPFRVAGTERTYRDRNVPDDDLKPKPAGMNVIALRLPALERGAVVNKLGTSVYEKLAERTADWQKLDPRRRGAPPDLTTLWEVQQGWSGNRSFGEHSSGLTDAIRAALLASTRNYHLPAKGTNFQSPASELTTGGLPDLDVSHWLMRGEAVLLAWAGDPGPVEVVFNGRPMRPYSGITLYRVRLPLHYEGMPPRGSEP